MCKSDLTPGSSRERIEFTRWNGLREFVGELAEKDLVKVEGLVSDNPDPAEQQFDDISKVFISVEKKELGEVLLAKKTSRKLKEEQIELLKQRKKRKAYAKVSLNRKPVASLGDSVSKSKCIQIEGFGGEAQMPNEALGKRSSERAGLGDQEQKKPSSTGPDNHQKSKPF